MSDGGGETGGGYGGFPSPTPSSTVPDGDPKSLPPFSSFQDEPSRNTDGEALQSSRLLDISWDYYGEGLSGRFLDRGDGFPLLLPQPQYRPWESKDHDYPGSPAKLPSFQSQFTAFPQEQNGDGTVLTTLTPAPSSPNSLPSFHTLSTVPPRGYPLVPAPVQAREIPSIQQQLLDERHIHLFQGPQQYHQLGSYQPQQQATLLTVVKTEPLIVTQLQPSYEHHELKMEDSSSPRGYLDSRKKERRKIRAASLESSNESDGVGSSSVESSGQVAAISSTAGFKSPLACHQNPNMHPEDDLHDLSDKPAKKKRKRCGECIGCQRKDNCGDCAPCRNDKSHQICKMRRCEKLTEKKHLLYLNPDYTRGERGRGRGKGRGAAGYRKVSTPRSPAHTSNLQINGGGVENNMMTTTLPDHTTVRGETKLETPPSGRPGGLPSIPGNAVPLYPGSGQPPIENSFTPLREPRFPNSVWQPNAADPNALGGTWTPQGQFIQQLPPHQIDDLRYSQYSVAGYPQPTPVVGYQQGSFVQSNGTVYSSTGPQAQPSPHSLHNGNSRSTPTLNGNLDYIDQSPRPSEFINGTYHSSQDVMAPPTSSTPTSRCGSAQLESSTEGKYTNPPTPTTPSNQGNAMPGYPHQIPPQSPQSSLNSSGYPGQESASLKGEQKTTQNVWSRSSSTNSLHNDVEKSPSSSKDWLNQMDGNRQMAWKNNQDSFGRQSEWMADSSDNSKTPTKNTQKQESWSTKEENRSVEQSSEKWSPEASPSPITNQQEQQSPKQDSSGQAVNGNTHQFNNTQVQSNQVQQLQQQQQQQAQQQQQQQAQQQQQIQQQQQQQAQQQQQQAQQQQQQQQQAQQQQQQQQQQAQQQQQQQQQAQQQQQQQQAQQQQQQQAQQQQQQQAQQQAIQQQLKQQQLQQQHQQQQQQLQQQQQQLQQQQLNQQLQQHHQQLNQQLHQQQQKQQQLSQQLQLNQRLNQQIQQQQLNQQLQQHQQQLAQHQQMHQQQHTPQHSPHHTIQHSPHQQYQISQQQHQISQKQANLQTSQQQQEQSSQLQHQISQQQQHQLSPQQHQIPSQLQQHQISQQAQASAHQHQMAQQQHLLHQQQLAQQKQHLTHHLSQQQHISQQQKHLAQQAQHQQQYMFTHHPLAQHQQQHLIQHQQQKQLISQQQMKQSKQSQLNLHEVQQNPQQSIHNNRQNIWSNNGDGAPMANNSLSQQNVHLWANGSHTQQNSLWSSESNNVQQNHPEPWPNGQYQAGNQQQSQVPSSNWGGDKKNSKVQERAELNNRLKTMILNKQNQDSKKTDESQNQTIYEDQKNLQSVSSGNFLAKGHHPQKLVSEGGGTWGESPQKYNQSISAMENFVKYATSMGSPDLKQNWNEPTYSHASYQNSLNFERPQNGILFPTNQEQGRKVIQQEQRPHQPFPSWYPNYPMPYGYNHTSHIKYEALWYQKQEPWGTQTEFISRDLVNTSYIPKIPFGMDPRLDEPIEKIDEEDGVLKKMQAKYVYHGDGGPVSVQSSPGPWCCRQGGTDKPSAEHTKDGCCQGYQTQDEILESDKDIKNELDLSSKPSDMTVKEYVDYLERLRNNRTEIPNCQCFPPDQCPPEPGSYYTHLGSASSLEELRTNIESRSGLKGKAIRVEKIVYTGKEGKTTAGCPLAKWIIRRGSLDEKILLIVKNRKGHTCSTAWIVVVVVAWEGVATQEADSIYALLTSKLNKFGVPTTRRCATNEPRTCACQGLDMATCGSSYSFGCSWSMYYNGCKYARSKVVRKFRLSVRSEEQDIEDKMQKLATDLGPLYEKMAPDSYKNQIKFEKEAIACRLGLRPGRPFSGVTACFDFCAHAHRDAHNMNNGCTVVVTLTKHRTLSKPDDEQLHVLPLYIMDETDEYGNREGQLEKINNGSLESLSKYPCEVRVRAVPLTPCRKHGKKRKDEEEHQNQLNNGKNNSKEHSSQTSSDLLQSSQVSSTVIDSPVQSNQSWGGGYQNSRPNSVPNSLNSVKTTFSPHSQQFNNFQEKRPHSHHGEMSYGFETEVKTDPDSTTNHAQWEDRSPGCNISGRSSYFQLPSPNHQTHLPSPKGSNAVSPINNSEGSNREDKPYSISPCNSVFRVPKGRPPSRSNSSTPQPTIENSTYIKPLPAFPPLEHRFDRPNSPIRDWDNIPQSSQKSPRSSQYSNGILHHSPGSVNENNHDQSYKPQNSPGAGVKEQSQGTQTMKQSPSNYNQSCSNGVRRSPVPQQVAPNGGTSSQNFNSMFNNQFPSYPNLYNPSNGYIEYNNNHLNSGNPTYYPDHNYGSTPNYHYYENFSKANHNSAVQNANQLHPNEQTYQSNANGHVYPGQTDGLRNGFRNVNNNILPGKQKEINGNCFASSFEPYKGDRPVKPSTPHLLPNIKKENCQWQYCSSNPVSPGGPKNGIASPSGGRPPSSNAQQEVHIKREKDERSMSQCEHRFPDYPNGVFPNQTHPGPNPMPYARSPHWAHSLVSPPYIKEETEHILHPPFDPDFHANHLQSHPSLDYQGVGMYQLSGWDNYGPTPYLPMIKEVKPEPIGQVADFIDNEECFKDSQMGGVAIALSHGSVLFECAKHELHATTALHKPNRLQPTRISLVFYQHRNLNRPNHGANEWEEKMRLRKLGTSTSSTSSSIPNNASPPSPAVLRSPTYTTTTWTTLFPMHPCVGTGPYQKT